MDAGGNEVLASAEAEGLVSVVVVVVVMFDMGVL